VYTIESCWTWSRNDEKEKEGGGFGGGPGQMPHCATSYAAVQTLIIIAGQGETHPNASEMALDLLRRIRGELYVWFLTLRHQFPSASSSSSTTPCGYRMHHDGEVDVRATYTICAMASLLNVLTERLTEGMAEYIALCQTFEGAFGGVPYAEAHGGYTYCALAALHILITKPAGATKVTGEVEGNGSPLEDCEGLDVEALRGWLSRRQMGYEGGFQGRCNKLVDGCYSFWIGGAIAILDLSDSRISVNVNVNVDIDIDESMSGGGEVYNDNDCKVDDTLAKNFDSGVFACDNEVDEFGMLRSTDNYKNSSNGMDVNENEGDEDGFLTFDQKLLQRYILLCGQDVNGGLRDKPSKSRDFYHSCYNLSGLSVSQHVLTRRRQQKKKDTDNSGINNPVVIQYEQVDYNVLGVTHPVYNVRLERVLFVLDAFHKV